ncbi:hypothetical protein ACJ73_08783 [Blastomyces percursus]|uniref:Uncharacterized protein n=1 Tax=Blastomyces percursus TaxID=1658174 RepID=A0A1J9PMI4_9EURO|nr:hypothetical protein ACJ73_08783 [Blastomyces percursus]
MPSRSTSDLDTREETTRTDKHTVRSLANNNILPEALDKKLLFVGLKSGPGRKGMEPLGSVNASSGNMLLEDIREYLSSFNVLTGKRVRSDVEEWRQKRVCDVHLDNEMERG